MDEKIQFMVKVCLEKMSSVLVYIIKNTEHLKLNKNEFMGVMDELKMDSGITMESTPKKADTTSRKRKIELDANETQGPEMNNPLNPVYKPGPTGDKSGFGWLVVFGLNDPLRQYFSLYRVVSQR